MEVLAELSSLTMRRWFPVEGGVFTFEFLYAELCDEMRATTSTLGVLGMVLPVRAFAYELPLFLDASEIIHNCLDAARERS
jgi:hypothetical protein